MTSTETENALRSLEREIGVAPNLRLLKRIDAQNKTSVQSWLVLMGIDRASVIRAKDDSLKNAYNNQTYRAAWLRAEAERKANGKQLNNKTLSVESMFGDEEEKSTIAKQEIPSSKNLPSSSLDEKQIEIIALKTANAQIESLVPNLLESALSRYEIQLTDSVKAAIRTLASNVALAAIEANKSPREIVVTNPVTKESINIGLQHEKFDTLLRAAQARNPSGYRLNIWLTGPAGSGKTTGAENVAKALNLPFASDGSLDADYKVLGFRDAAGNVHSTEFLRVFQHGGIYCADEIDNWLPSALLSLNSALANGFVSTPGGMIKRHKDFICIACANTWGLGANSEYVGRNKLDAASLDRFQPKIDWPIDEKLESALSANLGWTRTVQLARAKAKTQGLKILISPRATLAGAALLAAGFSRKEVISMTFGAGISPEQSCAIGIES